jgi:hypothetical protein
MNLTANLALIHPVLLVPVVAEAKGGHGGITPRLLV